MTASLQVRELLAGRRFDLNRRRSAGTLNAEELAYCRQHAIPLAFDPIQQGMVVSVCLDDIAPEGQRDLKAPHSAEVVPQHDHRLSGGKIWDVGDERHKLRAWTRGDAVRYAELLGDPEVWAYLPEEYPGSISEEMAAGLIDLSNGRADHIVFAIELDGLVVGQIRLLFEDGRPTSKKGEISYWLGRDNWGQGTASAVIPRFTRDCFSMFGNLETIIARVHRDNIGSARVIQKSRYLLAGVTDKATDWDIFETDRIAYSASMDSVADAETHRRVAA